MSKLFLKKPKDIVRVFSRFDHTFSDEKQLTPFLNIEGRLDYQKNIINPLNNLGYKVFLFHPLPRSKESDMERGIPISVCIGKENTRLNYHLKTIEKDFLNITHKLGLNYRHVGFYTLNF
ncbi:MAG: hypothetical protein NT139_03360 [Candidatus Woesearchaeota archaeon]|nr:hypothetical protein [Candidatus Woesearchaeota archaeon]